MSKVLIVEDEIPLRMALKTKLTSEGITVLEAKDGAEGVQMAMANRPDLILLDIIMPKMNGIDVLKDLKNNVGLANVPVFMLTNLSEESTAKIVQELGAEEYLVKSNIKIEDLAAKIKTRLGGK